MSYWQLRARLRKLGWQEGRNVRFDYRWAPSNLDLIKRSAKELIALQPDLILSSSTPSTASLLQQAQTFHHFREHYRSGRQWFRR